MAVVMPMAATRDSGSSDPRQQWCQGQHRGGNPMAMGVTQEGEGDGTGAGGDQ